MSCKHKATVIRICFLVFHRLDASNANGIKVITPIRPILILANQHDLNETTLRLM